MDVLGLAVYPVAFALVLVANLTPATPSAPTRSCSSLFLPVHATLAFFGYAALFVAFAMGVLYLIQERELKSALAARLLLPGAQPRALRHHQRAQRRRWASAS